MICKKSVSPLIATVLLIAFVVAIGSVVMNWGTGYIKSEQQKATSTSDVRLTCATDVSLKLMKINNLQDYCYSNNSENVTISARLTKGIENFKGIRVNIISNNTDETLDYNYSIDKLNFQLNLGGFSTELINENNVIEYIELVPYIDNNGENFFCSGSSLVLNEMYFCNNNILEIENENAEQNNNENFISVPFISVWNTVFTSYDSSNSTQIKLPLVESGSYSFTINWGDENQDFITSWDQEEVLHNYESSGVYQIEINGTIIGFAFDYEGDRNKIIEIKQWGDLRLGNTGSYFEGAYNLNINTTDVLNLSGTTNLSEAFYEIYETYDIYNISEWDVSNIIDFSGTFCNAEKLNISLSNWNVSNGRYFQEMFYYTPEIDFYINDWDMSNAENIAGMLGGNYQFNQPLDKWDVSSVTDMTSLFKHNRNFNQDISMWNVSNVESMAAMFEDASSFNQNISGWDVSKVTRMNRMFMSATSFNQSLNDWNVSNVIQMDWMFASTSYNLPLDKWDLKNLTKIDHMFATNYVFNQPLNGWNVSSVTDMSMMFNSATSFNQSLNDWDVSNVKDMRYMFSSARSFDQPLNHWNVSKVTDMSYMFSSASNFTHSLNDWDVSNVKDMRYMFMSASNFNQPLNNWDVHNVTRMDGMFRYATSFNQPLNNWDVHNVTRMSYMFYNAVSFNQDISNWCVTNVTTYNNSFATSSALIFNNQPEWGTCP